MKNILFPTDFSESARKAFVYALQFARATGAGIITVHVYKTPRLSQARLPHTLREAYESISLEAFENYRTNIPMLREIAESCGAPDVPMSHVMEHGGDTVETILKVAERDSVDLIIMGTTGAGFFKELFLGSVAAEVMENAEVPVLAIPRSAVFTGDIRRIAVTTELGDADILAVLKIREFAQFFNARLTCIYVDTAHTAAVSARVEAFKKHFVTMPDVEFEIIDGIDVEESVRNYVRQNRVDMLGMLIRQRSRLQELFTFSMTKRFSYHLDTPILAVQARTLLDA